MPSQLDDWLLHDSSEINRKFAGEHETSHELFISHLHGVLIITLVIVILVVVELLKRCIRKRNDKREIRNSFYVVLQQLISQIF